MKISRARICQFSVELRERQILRGLGLGLIASLVLAAHMQQVGKFPEATLLSPQETAQIPGKLIGYSPLSSAAVSQVNPTRPTVTALTLPAHWSIESANIKGSFARTAQHAGLTKAEIASLKQIFADKIDFKNLRNTDRFKIVTERIPANAHQKAVDNIVAAQFVSGQKTYTALQYHDNYYQPDGSSLTAGFLRYPTHFTRIGSGFMIHRLDPITGKYHTHPAIDFDAPMGTPITATADGKINYMAYETGYGNVVRINHAGNVMTLYAHMRNFANGLHAGSPVKKGEVIGYVGMSGYATGPHVHYELHFGAKPVNPLTTQLPSAAAIHGSQKSDFNQMVKKDLAFF